MSSSADHAGGGPAAADPTNPFTAVPVDVTVCVGRARPMIRDLVKLGENAVLTLDSRVDDPVELFVGDRLIARGLLEEKEDGIPGQLVVRLTEIMDAPTSL